ncbi:DUF4157 domain-containing protein [Chitinimonas arctica]|uniref:DUF4157 domain-containing protein n=1 Tax=Chitinimonas arctica TaxID=2594795 RepID=A0A516SLH8_9NEIS|nr:DUF4157 domain-containing protein [Chitinimonas arctica]QDQ29002.1 DUF4157 domain-containing protein [Chitinimonas arctica]
MSDGHMKATLESRGKQEGATLSRPPVPDNVPQIAPPVVGEVIHGAGTPLAEEIRRPYEMQLGRDFSGVRIHGDAKAAESADAVAARAYTVGQDVVFNHGQFRPDSREGQRLLAHELTHVGQQASDDRPSTIPLDESRAHEADARSSEQAEVRPPVGASIGASVLQRTPAAPSWKGATAVYDRAQVGITPIADINLAGGAKVATQTIKPNISATGANHQSWELYDANDKLADGFSTVPGRPGALTAQFELSEQNVKGQLGHGRCTLRCVARKDGSPLAYADQTFFVNTSNIVAVMDRPALAKIGAAPASHSLGEVGAAKARDAMLEHQAAIASGGVGTLQGNKCSTITPGVAQSDCTQYVYDILKYAFGAKGDGATWKAVATEASKLSGSGGLRGTALQTALETKAGWKGVFWAPSPRNPEDGTSEHPSAYKRVREKGLYTKDDVAVEKTKSIIDYRPKSTTKAPTFSALDQLKKVPLGVISARGGTHMTLLINGQVYEVHWEMPATNPNVIQATPLEKWQWQSGAIVMPAADFAAAFP